MRQLPWTRQSIRVAINRICRGLLSFVLLLLLDARVEVNDGGVRLAPRPLGGVSENDLREFYCAPPLIVPFPPTQRRLTAK